MFGSDMFALDVCILHVRGQCSCFEILAAVYIMRVLMMDTGVLVEPFSFGVHYKGIRYMWFTGIGHMRQKTRCSPSDKDRP